jgi:hypothetical protein
MKRKLGGLKFGAAGLGAAIIAAMALASLPAEAQTSKKKKTYVASNSTRVATARPRARIRVEPRSFLDLGTETLPGERKYTDYAFPPGYSVLGTALGPGRDFRRAPLLDPWDFPGMSKF